MNRPDPLISRDTDQRVTLTDRGFLRCQFDRASDGLWRIGPWAVWDPRARRWRNAWTSLHGAFLHAAPQPDWTTPAPNTCAYADSLHIERGVGGTGLRFAGTLPLQKAELRWSARFLFQPSEPLRRLKMEIDYSVDRSLDAGFSPQVIMHTLGLHPAERPQMEHIISYEPGDKAVLIERGYPLIWLHHQLDGLQHHCLLISDVRQGAAEGRRFRYNRLPSPPGFCWWSLGAVRPDESPLHTYYWTYRDPATGDYPEETRLKAGQRYQVRCSLTPGLHGGRLDFYRQYWPAAMDTLCPVDRTPRWPADWGRMVDNQIRAFRPDSPFGPEMYVPGKGYYSAPAQDAMSHGAGQVVWHGTMVILHAMLYYCWTNRRTDDLAYYRGVLTDVNLPAWAAASAENRGFINEFWIKESGHVAWTAMWSTLDFGAYHLHRIAKITGDRTYGTLFKRLMEYIRTLIGNVSSFGEHWNDQERAWYYLTPESHFTKAERIPPGGDHGEYPGALAVYADLCLSLYQDTRDRSWRDEAFRRLDLVNSYLNRPQQFWTLCRTPKPNGFAFACRANVRRYELTKDARYLDIAEEWACLLFTLYHLRSEGYEDVGLAHAGGLGVFDYVCVATYETVHPICVASALLRYRKSPIMLRYMALAQRRHSIVYPAGHAGQTFRYAYTPMELIPQRASFAQYMAGPPVIEYLMFQGLHRCNDPELTVICLDPAETSMQVHRQRTLLLYNPTGRFRSATLRPLLLDPGRYRWRLEGAMARTFSHDELMTQGIPFALKPQECLRATLEPA